MFQVNHNFNIVYDNVYDFLSCFKFTHLYILLKYKYYIEKNDCN